MGFLSIQSRKFMLTAIAAAVACFVVFAAEVADFAGGTGTNGWTVSAEGWTSPEYSGAVERIRLEYVAGVVSGSAKVYAMAKNAGEPSEIASLNTLSSAAEIEFPDVSDLRSFRVSPSGGFELAKFSAEVSPSSIDAPSGVSVSNNTTGVSFDAYWMAVENATGYKVYVWTNALAGASSGTPVWQETFANAPAKTSSTAFNVSYTDSGESAWTFDKVYAHSEAGMVRIGNTSAKGVLVSPALGGTVAAGGSLMLRLHAWKQASGDGDFMPIGIVSDGATNILEVLEITTTRTEYYVELPTLSAADCLALFSPTNKASARAIIDDVAILSGYSEGHLEPVYIVNALDVGNVTTCSLDGLPSVPVCFSVEAYGRHGVTSAKTEGVTVDLSDPDDTAALNAYPISSLVGNTYSQNFDSLAALTATTGDKDWLSGTTLEYWQAYKGGDAVTSFNYNGGGGTVGGLYALAANRSDTVRALGAYSTKDNEFSFGLSFTNDTDKTIALSSINYSAEQWGFKNTANQTLSVSARVADTLEWISAYGDGWTELGSTQSETYTTGDSHETPVAIPVSISPATPISIEPGQVLALKWTIHSLKSGTPGMMGIDDLFVVFEVHGGQKSFIMILADGKKNGGHGLQMTDFSRR